MSRPRYAWWGYVKEMIRKYPDRRGKVLEGVAADEQRAVQVAIDLAERQRNGRDRLKVVELVFWRRTHSLPGAALQIPCSERTARRYHTDFIKAVATNFQCNSLLK